VGRTAGILSRGAVSGVVGAAALAMWFLLVDTAQGEPFRTPAMVGNALVGLEGVEVRPGLILLFLALHFGAFMVVGMAAAWAVSFLTRVPNLVFGLVLGFLMFDVVFFGSVAVTGVDVVAQLGWVEVLAGNILAGVAMMSFLQLSGAVKAVKWWEAYTANRVLREGVVSGFASGFMVATWFLIVDTIQGRPFFTPSALGSVFFLGATDLGQVDVSLWITAAYTPIHYAVFMAIGTAAAALAHQAEKQPPLLIGALLLFVAFQAFFLGIIAVVAEFLLGPLAWWNIAVGNIVGVAVMAGYLWKAHPKLREVMAHEPIEHPA